MTGRRSIHRHGEGRVPAEAPHDTVPPHQHSDARTRNKPPACGSGMAAARAKQIINPARILMTKALKGFT
ncbi:hypothetical protein E2C01_039188 [Portunus trituberculatus]|uniref:Uncharacterized protein n=1 Tax=Portunus trituberculatus TaxID=210409 RepID=A0A5B7FKP3_PORTR|nr:hypothetical protein [Portunus trituberculatus]